MANKNFNFYVRYIDPDEAASTTPAKRRERVAGPYAATNVQRALTKFYGDVADQPTDIARDRGRDRPWLKKHITVVDVMRGKGQAGPQMADEEELPEEND